MYKVAVIQNDSEMMRYSWADIRPMIQELEYKCDGYTSSNIDILFSKLLSYDSLVIATNACNNRLIRQSLNSNKKIIETFLNSGKGILMLFQMKKGDYDFYDFLPDEFNIETIRRDEDLKSGTLHTNYANGGSVILEYPNSVNIEEISKHCLTNKNVKGLYWTYLVPKKIENYLINLHDDSLGSGIRPLILTSRDDYKFRIVVSAIALDWQGHKKIFENSLKYITEGRTQLAVVKKQSCVDHDFLYLLSWLRGNKIPFHLYHSVEEVTIDLPLNIKGLYLVDPSFSIKKVNTLVKLIEPFIDEQKSEVIFFKKNSSIPKLIISSKKNFFQQISQNSTVWLISQFPKDHGYFGKSFWNTLDVLNTLRIFNVPIEQYKDRILAEIFKHDRGGSYDEVLGATCAMFEIYNLFLGAQHVRTLTSLQWIIENYKDKVLFERASAIDTLIRYECIVENEELMKLKENILAIVDSGNIINEFKLLRYCQTLFTCGFISEAFSYSLKFKETQDEDGMWINASHTSAVVELLIAIHERSEKNKNVLREMIFKGAEYLYESYDDKKFNWKDDVLSTAKSLRTLKKFEEKVSLPIDVVKRYIYSQKLTMEHSSAIDLSAKLNSQYVSENKKLQEEIAILNRREEDLLKLRNKLIRLLRRIIPLLAILLGGGILCIYMLSENKLWSKFFEFFGNFVSSNMGIILAGTGTLVLWLSIFLANEYKLIPEDTPEFIKKIIARIVPEPGFSIKKENESDFKNS